MHTLSYVVLVLGIVSSRAADVDDFLSFTSDWSCKDARWTNANRLTFCTWPGIICSATNAMQRLAWVSKSCTGTVDLSKLPATVTDIDVSSNNFAGPLLLVTSAVLRIANCAFNQFVSVDLTNPPSTLVNLNLNNNRITYTCPHPFRMLRPPLSRLIVGGWVASNMACDLDNTTLPNTLTALDLSNLGLKCCLDFASLPLPSHCCRPSVFGITLSQES